MSARRRLLFVLALALGAVLLLLAFAWPGAGVPWNAAKTLPLPLEQFQSPTGETAIRERSVRADAGDAAGVTLLRQSPPSLSAPDWRYLRYRVDGPSATSKRMLVWSGEAGQGTALLPAAAGTLDLSNHPAWRGSIAWLGIAAAPIDYLPVVALDASSVEVHQLQLEGPSWRGALGALWSDWRAARPWSGRSLNTGGFELSPIAGPSLTGFVALLGGLAWGLAALLLGRATARRLALPVAIGAVAVLALHQVVQLADRGASASAAVQQVRKHPDAPLAAQPQLAAAAQRLSRGLRQAGGTPRLLVHGANQFVGEYSVWLLRAHDVAMLWEPGQLPPPGAAGDWRVVLVGSGDWAYDEANARLRIGAEQRDATLDVDGGLMKSYRLGGGGAP